LKREHGDLIVSILLRMVCRYYDIILRSIFVSQLKLRTSLLYFFNICSRAGWLL
jgi:hypothetical protein